MNTPLSDTFSFQLKARYMNQTVFTIVSITDKLSLVFPESEQQKVDICSLMTSHNFGQFLITPLPYRHAF